MIKGVSTSSLSKTSTSAGVIEVLDHQWDAGAEIEDYAPDVLLRLRLWPLKLRARGWLESGYEGSFGPLMMMPANGVTHGYASEAGESVRTVEFRCDRQWLNEMVGCDSDWTVADPSSCLSLRELNIEHSMRRLGKELLEPERGSETMINSLAISVGIDLSRVLLRQGSAGSLTDLKGTLTKSKLRQVEEYVRSFSDGSPSLIDVASECGFSVAHLRRVFKSTTGKTVHDFIEEVRIERAQQLLRESSLRLKTISYQLGFSHPSAFSFAFKKATGGSPGDYRRRFGAEVAPADDSE